MNRRVLMLTAAWPPVARVGARRPLRLARRLSALGWDPEVITPTPESVFRTMPALDESLVEPDIPVHRVPALIPSTRVARGAQLLPAPLGKGAQRIIEESLFPDQYPAWSRAACKMAKSLKAVDAVWVTGGPWGMFVVGEKVAHTLGVPLILDYRDPWTVDLPKKKIPLGRRPGRLKKLERKLLSKAAGVSYVNTDMLARNVAAFGPGPKARWVVIPNGFDPLDVVEGQPTQFMVPTIVYAGACYGSRSMLPVLGAFRMAEAQGLPPIQLRIFGELDPAAQAFLSMNPMPHRVSLSGRISAAELANHTAGASALLLLVGETHRTALTGKLFDYLQAKRPILGYGPAGCDAEAVVRRCGAGVWSSTPEQLLEHLGAIQEKTLAYAPVDESIRLYSADIMAERTADLLDQVVVESS